MATTGRPGYLRVINGGLSKQPGSVQQARLTAIPATFIQLEAVNTFTQDEITRLTDRLTKVWAQGDDESRSILYGTALRLCERMNRARGAQA